MLYGWLVTKENGCIWAGCRTDILHHTEEKHDKYIYRSELFLVILVINQLNAQKLVYNKFIICLYMARAQCAHHQEVKIVLYSIWYHHTYRWPSGAQVERIVLSQSVHRTATYRCDDTRCCIIQF